MLIQLSPTFFSPVTQTYAFAGMLLIVPVTVVGAACALLLEK
jgi:hypothetical protein